MVLPEADADSDLVCSFFLAPGPADGRRSR